MDTMNKVQAVAGRGFPRMVVALALALTVNASFGAALAGASTTGQKIYAAWYHSGAVMYADASGSVRKLCAKG
ncbi:MAG: hypothetical protein OSA97_13030 [Nevskia sp.]|nr:hypothetical protein [Nevskia sp.]